MYVCVCCGDVVSTDRFLIPCITIYLCRSMLHCIHIHIYVVPMLCTPTSLYVLLYAPFSYAPFSAGVSSGKSHVLSDGRVVTSSWPDTYHALLKAWQ